MNIKIISILTTAVTLTFTAPQASSFSEGVEKLQEGFYKGTKTKKPSFLHGAPYQ